MNRCLAILALLALGLSLGPVLGGCAAGESWSGPDEADSADTKLRPAVRMVVHCITPNVSVVDIEGKQVAVFPQEQKTLDVVSGARLVRTKCLVSVTLSNETDRTYLLSESHLRTMLTRATWRDDSGSAWEVVNTSSHVSLGQEVYTVPSVAGVQRSFVLELGLTRLVRAGSEAEPLTFPDALEYELRPCDVGCRQVVGRVLKAPTTIEMSGHGRCRVSRTGC